MQHAVLVEQIEEPPKGKQILTLPNHTKKISELENSSSIAEYFVNNVGCNNKLKNINRNYLNIGEIERLISKWRLSREVILTDPDWPDFLRNIDRPYGLTKMDVGHFGEIPSMENWRNNELKRI